MGLTELSVSVFAAGEGGGNPCTIVEGRCSAEDMTALAQTKGHECCLAIPNARRSFTLRFFSPGGEMDMCAHASAAAAWFLCEGDGSTAIFESKGGAVRAYRQGLSDVSISQPAGTAQRCASEPALRALGLIKDDLADPLVLNAASTRMKTLLQLRSLERLQKLDPDPAAVRAACDALGSTGLYPWVETGASRIEARQFPSAAGYREDPATGVAAAALFFALGAPADGLTVEQGRAMGRLSRMAVAREPFGDGCILTGRVRIIARGENSCMAASSL